MRRLVVLGLSLALALSTLGVVQAPPAAAASVGHSYLALGDSVPFGFSPLLDPRDAANFVGYPEATAGLLNIEDVNAACPGEASGGFISLTGTDNVCRPYREARFPLHAAYTTSQLDFAIGYLTSNPRTRLVTLTLGANDVFRLQKDCNQDSVCVGRGLPTVLAALDADLRHVFAALRATGYSGLIVGVTYYALNYGDPASVAGVQGLNDQMIDAAHAFGVLIASGFDAWAPVAARAGGDSCAAGLLIVLPNGGCDVHPTALGRDLLAQAVVQAVASSCPAASPTGCLDRHRG
jgi:lysophospholipase L1-like esterase